jgi:hypothetical protein
MSATKRLKDGSSLCQKNAPIKKVDLNSRCGVPRRASITVSNRVFMCFCLPEPLRTWSRLSGTHSKYLSSQRKFGVHSAAVSAPGDIGWMPPAGLSHH